MEERNRKSEEKMLSSKVKVLLILEKVGVEQLGIRLLLSRELGH